MSKLEIGDRMSKGMSLHLILFLCSHIISNASLHTLLKFSLFSLFRSSREFMQNNGACKTIIYVTGYGKTDHFAHNFKIELLVFKGSVDLKQ